MNEQLLPIFTERGIKDLTLFYEQRKDTFSVDDYIEYSFRTEGVVIGDAHITGRIDKMKNAGERQLIVYDYKTGRPKIEWEGRDLQANIQLHKYRRQLIFYKLLVEQSKTFAGYTVDTGVLTFINNDKGTIVDLTLAIEEAEVERTKELVHAVCVLIHALEFPDISAYPKNLEGMRQFEDDVLARAKSLSK